MAKIAAGVLLLAGIGLFAQAVISANERGVELGGPTLAPLIVTGMWVVVAAGYALQAFRTEVEKIRLRTPLLLLGILIAYAFVLKYTVVGYVLATAAFYFGAARLLGSGSRSGSDSGSDSGSGSGSGSGSDSGSGSGSGSGSSSGFGFGFSKEGIVRDAIVSIGLSLGIYLLFTKLLSIGLPSGVLPL